MRNELMPETPPRLGTRKRKEANTQTSDRGLETLPRQQASLAQAESKARQKAAGLPPPTALLQLCILPQRAEIGGSACVIALPARARQRLEWKATRTSSVGTVVDTSKRNHNGDKRRFDR